jgi:putative restriction endonuclease
MKAWIGVTDGDWYGFLSARPHLDEVNFWQPSGGRQFRSLAPGEIFLFKLHHPDNYIVGGGVFAHFSVAPSRLAWDAFGEKNGAPTYEAMRHRIEKYKRVPPSPHEEYEIGCILLTQPFFFERSNWIPAPPDFAKNIVQGKTYDLTTGVGKQLWAAVQERLQASADLAYAEEGPVYGDPVLVKRRLGQGTFRLLVTDIYQKRCAVTGEKVLPVLQAAHIRPVSEGGGHRVDNGLLLRSDVHTLFDRGYVSVTPDHRVLVSSRLKKDFNNGEHYYQYQGREIWTPSALTQRPSKLFLEWHRDERFLG